MILKQDNLDIDIVKGIAKNYNTLDYPITLLSHLEKAYPKKNFHGHSKFDLHRLINNLLMNNYFGENIHKYKLVEKFKSHKRVTAAFEINVNSSRLDFLAINGVSTSFEIKSRLDNLYKLNKQLNDYQKAFEFNYLVIDKVHLDNALSMIPENIGLWVYEKNKYSEVIKANLSNKIDKKFQLSLLTKKEMKLYFNCDKTKLIIEKYNNDEINKAFKSILKTRYNTKWNFLVNNRSKIFPIDFQFFFKQNIDPSSIYKC
jgi:hypothetical protein